MSEHGGYRRKPGGSTLTSQSQGAAGLPAPGKRTLTEQLSAPMPVQQRAAATRADGVPPAPDAIHAEAAKGIATPAKSLPHGATIQQLFGPRHDVSHVQAHTGPEAAASAAAMGAKAYATGDHLVLGDQTDLHTVAHEAAHVVQQRGGVQLKGGVGEAGDAYEQHADAVADKVVRGESAEKLLEEYAGSSMGASSVQRLEQQDDKKAKKDWPGGPTVGRKSTTHTLAEYVGWLRQVEARFGAARDQTLQRLRRLYYSEYTGNVGDQFDTLIKPVPGADSAPMTTADLPLAVINGLYETNAIITPNGSEVDISHIFAELDARVAGGSLKAAVGEIRFGVNFEGVFTWVGDLASWWLEAKNTIAKRGGATMSQSDQIAILVGLANTKAAKDDLLGDVDAQVMADQFTTTTEVPVLDAPPVVLTTQNMPLSQMLTQYYGHERPTGRAATPGGSSASAPSPAGTPRGATSGNRFHNFVAAATPRIPHTRVRENPLTIALANDAPAQIREHLYRTARIFIDNHYTHGTPADLANYAALLDEVNRRFVQFLMTGLAAGDASWP